MCIAKEYRRGDIFHKNFSTTFTFFPIFFSLPLKRKKRYKSGSSISDIIANSIYRLI